MAMEQSRVSKYFLGVKAHFSGIIFRVSKLVEIRSFKAVKKIFQQCLVQLLFLKAVPSGDTWLQVIVSQLVHGKPADKRVGKVQHHGLLRQNTAFFRLFTILQQSIF
jgi:hypothetical protein